MPRLFLFRRLSRSSAPPEAQGSNLALPAAKGKPDTHNWVIVEITPAWQTKSASLAPGALRKLVGTKIQVTGWLYFEPDEEQPDPRGTRWEITRRRRSLRRNRPEKTLERRDGRRESAGLSFSERPAS